MYGLLIAGVLLEGTCRLCDLLRRIRIHCEVVIPFSFKSYIIRIRSYTLAIEEVDALVFLTLEH